MDPEHKGTAQAQRGTLMSDELQRFLAHRDEACPSCGYNLRGLASGRCPECRTDLVLRVSVAEPRLGLFLSTVVAWALGAGFSALLLVYIGVASLVRPMGMPPLWPFLVVPILGTLVQGSAVLALVLFQRRVRRWDLGVRIALLAAGAACTLLNVVVFALLVD